MIETISNWKWITVIFIHLAWATVMHFSNPIKINCHKSNRKYSWKLPTFITHSKIAPHNKITDSDEKVVIVIDFEYAELNKPQNILSRKQQTKSTIDTTIKDNW